MLTSFIFGCYAAVMASNRVPALYCHVFRSHLAISIVMYFDDAAMGDAAYERQSGQAAVNAITSLLLLDFDEAKHEDTDQTKRRIC